MTQQAREIPHPPVLCLFIKISVEVCSTSISNPPQAGELSIFTIPPVWKRVAAETIDFFILIVLKVMITFIAVDFFELVDLDQYQLPLDLLSLNPDKLDVRLALQFTQEILVLELVHRMVVCLFEALCTHRGPPGMPGGATPGKVIMGLRIIRCNQVRSPPDHLPPATCLMSTCHLSTCHLTPDHLSTWHQVTPLGGSRVRVLPASDLGLGWAAVRSILKNFSLAFFFPVCFSLLFLPYSRTLYDVMARSIGGSDWICFSFVEIFVIQLWRAT